MWLALFKTAVGAAVTTVTERFEEGTNALPVLSHQPRLLVLPIV
jgi:hypothetical protein